VAIILNLNEPEVTKLYREYWKLRGLNKLDSIHKETNGKIWIVLKLYKQLIKKRHMSIEQVVNVVDIAIHKLPHMESLYRQIKDEVDKMHLTRQALVNDIDAKKYKISVLDKTAFSCEQDCKRTEQRVQELTDKKNRIEKLIANILKNEGFSKLKHIVKETVKDSLSENKQVILVSFAALIQTLKADPQMVKLIHNIPNTNDAELHKDNNNVIKYLEFNQDSLLYLAQKHYENLLEALTNNAIDAAVVASDSTLSLPQPSPPTFPNPSEQSDTDRIEESQSFHDSKGDIAD
jgi:hypothetical protein